MALFDSSSISIYSATDRFFRSVVHPIGLIPFPKKKRKRTINPFTHARPPSNNPLLLCRDARETDQMPLYDTRIYYSWDHYNIYYFCCL